MRQQDGEKTDLVCVWTCETSLIYIKLAGDDVKSQVILKEVWMKVIEQKNCQEKLRKTKLGEFFVLDESFICAGGEVDIDMCTVRNFATLHFQIPLFSG